MADPLRIALLVDPLTPRSRGGGHAPELARELGRRGHSVRGFGQELPGEAGSVGTERGLLGFRPHALVAYDPLSPTAWLGARASRRLRAGLLLVEAGLLDPELRLHHRLLHGIGEHLWGSYVRHTASQVVALDPVARASALAKGFPIERVAIVPDGIDCDAFRPGLGSPLVSQYRLRGRILLYLGAIESGRDLETLVNAFARSIGQRDDWALVLAGDGSLRPRLRAEAERQGVADRVRWLPRPRLDELPGLIGASTLLAAPACAASDLRGRQIARAMACGVPVIAARLPRIEHLVEPDRTGLLVAPGDTHAWAAALSHAAGSPTLRERWGRRARELALERLSWSAVAQGFEALIARCAPRAAA